MAVPQGFRPKLSPTQVRDYQRLYDQQPDKFNDQTVEALKLHAEYYRLPFAEDNDSFLQNVADIGWQAGVGFKEGFTTLQSKDIVPENDYEAIARNVGHLAGFVGYFPAVGTGKIASLLKGLKGKSFPMWVAGKATKKAKKLVNTVEAGALTARVKAGKDAVGFFQNEIARDMVTGGIHLGVASAVSSWQGGLDEMMRSGAHGATAGVAFRAIGNFIQTGDKIADKVARGAVASLYTGLPSTVRGDTTPMQVYQYLLGAYFGVNESPASYRKGMQHYQRMLRTETDKHMGDPSKIEGWDKLSPEAQKVAIKHATDKYSAVQAFSARISTLVGKDPETVQRAMRDILEGRVQYSEEGELLIPVEFEVPEKFDQTPVKKIISGFQSGADIAGSDAGKTLGLKTGGDMPAGFPTEAGKKPEYAEIYGAKEIDPQKTKDYTGANKKWGPRTEQNVINADGTVLFGDMSSPGSQLTKRHAEQHGKPFIINPSATQLRIWLKDNKIETLNVAGNREKKTPGIYASSLKTLTGAMEKVPLKTPFVPKKKTGFTEAGEELSEIERSGEDVDPQNVPVRLSSNALTFALRDEHMHSYLRKLPLNDRQQAIKNLSDTWLDLLKINKPKGINPATDMAKYIKETYPEFEYKTEHDRFWKNIGFVRIRQQPVEMFTTTVNYQHGYDNPLSTTRRLLLDDNGVGINDAGNRKYLAQERKRIDEVLREDWLARYGEERSLQAPSTAYGVLDHIVQQLSGGSFKEYSLESYKQYLAAKFPLLVNKPEIQKLEVERLYNREIAKVMKQVSDTHDMYYYGGKGDAERLYFVKHHPETPLKGDYSNVKAQMKYIKEQLVDGLLKKYKDKFHGDTKKAEALVKKKITEIELDRARFVKDYGEQIGKKAAGHLFDRAYISNSYYTVRMNGFEFLNGLSIMNNGKGSWISNAKGFNKRSQIWFTSGYSADSEALALDIKGVKGVKGLENGELNVALVEDLGIEGTENLINVPASKFYERGDGAIMGQNNVVFALNNHVGLPTEGGTNKSFIVSPSPKYGALLGKYAIYNTSEKFNKYLEDNNIHLVIPKSAAKQYGLRVPGEILWENGQPRVELGKGEIYKLPVDHVKVVMSDITDAPSFLKPQKFPKQMFTNLTPYIYWDEKRSGFKVENEMNERATNIIQDMITSLTSKRAEGVTKYNKALDKLDPKKPTYRSDVEYLADNIDNIGIDRLLSAIRLPGYELLTNRIYFKLQNAKKLTNELERTEEGETDMGLEESNRLLSEYVSIHERLQNISGDSLGAHLHKYTNEYRQAVVSNYISDALTRPKIGNSAKARMRIYEKGMEKEGRTSILEKRDDVYFLDNGYKELPIDIFGVTGERKPVKLGELWDRYKQLQKNPKSNAEKLNALDEVFRSVLVRVPMDSMSGAQVLRFRGFTDIDGLGVLMHGRALKALGGADLDGDSAFVFFGGRSEAGDGNGFKRTWKDIYDWSRDEHFVKGVEEDAKNLWRSDLTFGGEKRDRIADNEALALSPYTRQQASQAAYEGRKQLGIVVTQTAALKSAHAATMAMPNQTEEVRIRWGPRDNKEWRTLRITANNDPKNLHKFRSMSKAAIAFSSDPMDEAGLNFGTWGQRLLRKQADLLFKYEIMNKDGKTVNNKATNLIYKNVENLPSKVRSTYNRIRENGAFYTVRRANQGVYGRNWREGRNLTMDERLERLDQLDEGLSPIRSEYRNTFLPQIGAEIGKLNWGDNILRRLTAEKLVDLHSDYNKNLDKYTWIREALGRKSLEVPNHEYILWVHNKGLHKREILKRETNPDTWNEDLFEPKGDTREAKRMRKQLAKYRVGDYETNKKNRVWRARKIQDIVRKADDFVVQNLSDMASVQDLAETGKWMTKTRAREIYEKADGWKKQSYLNASRAKEVDPRESLSDPYKIRKGEKVAPTIKKKTDRVLDQMTIDSEVKEYKKGLDKKEQEFLDSAMLSSLHLDSNNTSMSKLGMMSESVSDTSIARWMGKYNKMFDYTIEALPEKAARKLEKSFDQLISPREFIGADGEKIVGEVVESAELDATTRKYLDEWLPFKGLKEGKLNKEENELYYSIKEHLDWAPNWVGKDLNGIMRWLVQKDINLASLEDWKTLNRYMNHIRNGSLLQRIFNPVDKAKGLPPLSKLEYILFPRAVGEGIMRYDMARFEKYRQYRSLHGPIRGKVVKPTNAMESLQREAHTSQEQATRMYEEQKEEYDTDFMPYVEGLEVGDKLYNMAVAIRERGLKPHILKQEDDPSVGRIKAEVYEERYQKAVDKNDWHNTKNILLEVRDPKTDEITKMKAKDIVEEINKLITKWVDRAGGWIQGVDKDGVLVWDKKYGFLRNKYGVKSDWVMVKEWVKDYNKRQQKGERIDISLGIDGYRKLSKAQSKTHISKDRPDIAEDMEQKIVIEDTKLLPKEHYYPHFSNNPKATKEAYKTQVQKVLDDITIDAQTKTEYLTKLEYEFAQRSDGEFIKNSDVNDMHGLVDEVIRNISEKKMKKDENIDWALQNRRIGSQHHRSAHMSGYQVNPEIFPAYMKQIINNIHQHAAQVKMRDTIDEFRTEFRKKLPAGDRSLVYNWVDYFRLYTQDALGYPTKIPERILNNPDMRIKGTPYAWWSDSNVKKRIDKIRDMLGLEDKELPENLRGISYPTLAKWGNLEAKFQLASLLAHPKSMVANLYGGTVHTIISTGFHNWRNARNPKFLRHINPEWKSKEAVEKWVYKLGVVEDFLIYEAGLNPQFKSNKWKSFLKEATSKIRKDPGLEDSTLLTIAKKHGISDSMFDAAAWFMRRPERTLRRDAFMAHYLQARETFQGALDRFDDPVLIELGKKGVKATQFLYSAPFRPAFARSVAGKIYSRFQLWSWNSVRFRKDVIDEAHIRGWKEGTKEFERFKRLAMADMFMYALSGMFAYSLFESALPAPLNWFQDFSEWMFGDDRERERAFFGSYPKMLAPLQMVTPPVLRMLPPIFKGMVEGDWDKLSQYYVYTLFPFGRILRDVVGPNNLIENPMRSIEKLTGLPYMKLGGELKGSKDKEMLSPGGIIQIPRSAPEEEPSE